MSKGFLSVCQENIFKIVAEHVGSVCGLYTDRLELEDWTHFTPRLRCTSASERPSLWEGASLPVEDPYSSRVSVPRNEDQLGPNFARDAVGGRMLFKPGIIIKKVVDIYELDMLNDQYL